VGGVLEPFCLWERESRTNWSAQMDVPNTSRSPKAWGMPCSAAAAVGMVSCMIPFQAYAKERLYLKMTHADL
jgi:hypothetical protein